MTPFIPEDKLMEIKDAASLEEVVGQYVKLVQRGRNLLGLCPFHADTKPSFTVAPDKGIFHCFGCGAGGNVFSFLMQYHRLSFPEAVQELAKRYGIPITFRELGPEGGKSAQKRQLMQEINTLAAAFYQAFLKGSEGQAGREYLVQRGLTEEVIKAFHLGYAPNQWDALRLHLQNRGISLEVAQEVGLLVPRQSGGHYDRFRDRIIFPIEDRQGRVMAFGGRVVGEGEPKYLNSPESPLYSKGRHLFGLPQAAEVLRQTGVALVVEGYLDLLALRVHGIAPVLATLGTALTREQVRLLKSLVSKVVLVFDGDQAGARAMQRALPLFGQEGLAVRVLPLPPGLDPDSYAFKNGVEIFRSPWESAQPWFSYLMEELIKAHGLEIEGRVRILEELKPYLQNLADPVEQGLWLKVAAERLKVDEATLRRSLTSLGPMAAGRLAPAGQLLVNLEKGLLKWVLHHPTAVPWEELEEWAQEFEDQELKGLMALIINNFREYGGLDHSLLIQQVEAENLRQQICALTLGEEEFCGPAVDLRAADWRRFLKIRRLKKVKQALKEKLEGAVAADGHEEVPALQAKDQEIDRQLEALKVGPIAEGEN
ncbi:MAG: DNA primase [Desulfobaccales bacterium]|nr:DNA primase [Desulfobaccales bacterium]